MIDVMLLFTVTDKTGFLDCSKLTKMPALMPVGSSIIIHGPDDLEIEASISGYYWGDDESFIRVQTRECKITAGDDPLDDWKCDLESAGWTCKTYGKTT